MGIYAMYAKLIALLYKILNFMKLIIHMLAREKCVFCIYIYTVKFLITTYRCNSHRPIVYKILNLFLLLSINIYFMSIVNNSSNPSR